MKGASFVKKIGFFVFVCLIIIIFSACSMSEKKLISTDGSTSMERVIGYLSELYMLKNDNIKITYNPTGSSAGIQAVKDLRCDIGLSSRDLTLEEEKTLDAVTIAHDGIGLIVNKDNNIGDLTLTDIKNIYTGKITNWSELGGDDREIVCIGREAASGTREGFESATDTHNKCILKQELTSSGDVVQTVAGNPNAIGYTSIASVKDSVKLLKVDGIEPTTENIQSKAYKIQRDFLFVTKKGESLSSDVKSFLDFAKSDVAYEYIKRAGAVPARH